MLDWIAQNKEWIFSGIGAVILTGIVGWLFKRKQQPVPSEQPQKSVHLEDLTSDDGGFKLEDSTGDAVDARKIKARRDIEFIRSHGGPSPK